MKRMIIAVLSFFFLMATVTPVISKNYNRDTHNRRNDKGHFDNPRRHNDNKRPDYQTHRGYREHPYDRNRSYGHYDYKGHQYDYHGHWRSWEQWDNYARKHPNLYKHGTYYHENTHLMFRFCDPGTGGCFFFSIGR